MALLPCPVKALAVLSAVREHLPLTGGEMDGAVPGGTPAHPSTAVPVTNIVNVLTYFGTS